MISKYVASISTLAKKHKYGAYATITTLTTAAIWGYLLIPDLLEANRRYEGLFEESNKPIVGTVLTETRGDGVYSLKIKTDKGKILGVSILDGIDDGSGGYPIRKEALDEIVDVGMRICFPKGNMRHGNLYVGAAYRTYQNETNFTLETHAGNKRADRITVLGK